jgi:hypothetical protein
MHAVGLTPHDLGKPGKDLLPSTKAIILGVEIDTVVFTISLPADKPARTISALISLLTSPTASLGELRTIAGLLQFATRVLPPTFRAFICRIYDATMKLSPFR